MMSIADAGAWFVNVTSSVLIIFSNKLLMGSMGFGFNFAVTLSGLHYLAAALLMQFYKFSGLMSAKNDMPWRDRLLYVAVSSTSIISLNVSLLLNNVRATVLAGFPAAACWHSHVRFGINNACIAWIKSPQPIQFTAEIVSDLAFAVAFPLAM
jgi:hypothetical protein